MKCRKSVADLSLVERAAFVQAVLDLKNPAKSPSRITAAGTAVAAGGGVANRYDDYVWLHNQVGFGAHRGSAFGPWHREFLRQFEFDLQQVSGDPELTIPYWDWTIDNTGATAGWPFGVDFMGGFGNAATGVISSGPFANPAAWRINIRRAGDVVTTLKRSRGVPLPMTLPTRATVLRGLGVGVLAGTPWPSVWDAVPFNGNPPNTAAARTAQANAAFRKYLEWLLHDGIHVWVGDMWDFDANNVPRDGGHMSFPPVAVNDPVFWLHHCNVDRLWSIWQRVSPTSAYVPNAGASSGHNASDVMVSFGTPSFFATPPLSHPVDVDNHQAIGPWYHTDIPEIALSAPSVDFGDVPEHMTTFRPAQFAVRTCQPVTFTITGVSGAGFSIPAGQGPVVLDHDHEHGHGNASQTADVYVAFQALGAVGTPQAGSVTIQASIVDRDGYDSPAPGTIRILGTWTVNLVATTVARPRAAVALVLDRSGSMGESAGAAGTKFDLLTSSLRTVADLLRDDDAIGLISFDDVVDIISPVHAMGPLVAPAAGSGRQDVADAIAAGAFTPRGLTGIGSGMIAGAAALDAERLTAGTPYAQFAIIVATDGNQNVAPLVADPPVTSAISPYSSSVYAIGLGTPGNVSDTTLGQIATYMLITGDLTAADRRFRLTKYFIQILAGVTRTAIVVDPQADLHVGVTHRVPFTVTSSDLEVDVIVLCPLAPLLTFELEAPDGTVLDPAALGGTVLVHRGLDDAFYRLTLPVDPALRGVGQWHALLRLDRDVLDHKLSEFEGWQQEVLQRLRSRGTLPYSLIVRAYSNLELRVALKPTSLLSGATVAVFAALTEFGQPLAGAAEVIALVTDPLGQSQRTPMRPAGPGAFYAEIATTFAGQYDVRFLATGYSASGERFQREETWTVSAFDGDIPAGRGDDGDDKRRRIRDQ